MSRPAPRLSAFSALWQSERRIARAAWGVFAGVALAAGAGIALLHVWIFWERLASGRLFDGDSAVRWVVGFALAAALAALKREGVSLWWGRPAFTTWLLVALLHAWSAGAAVAAQPENQQPADQSAATYLLPISAATLVGLGAALLTRRQPTRRPRPASILTVHSAANAAACPPWIVAVRIPRAPPVVRLA